MLISADDADAAPEWGVLIFDPNGGTGGPNMMTIEYNWDTNFRDVTIPTDIPTRDGFMFLGWASTADSVDASYLPGETYGPGEITKGTSTSSATLFAVWVQSYSELLFESSPSEGTITYVGA